MSKGLTPVIAMILLLMMTVAAAGASFYWLIRIQGELQGGTQQFQEQTFERMTSNVNWQDATHYGSVQENQTLNITLLNTGTTKIPINTDSTSPKTQWTLLDSEQDIICTTDFSNKTSDVLCTTGCASDLAIKELRLLTIFWNGTAGSPCDLNVPNNANTTYPDDTLIYAKLNFNGKATASGTFRVDRTT